MPTQKKSRWIVKHIDNWPRHYILRHKGFEATVARSINRAEGWYVDIMAAPTETARGYYVFFRQFPGATVHEVKREAIRRINERDFDDVPTNGLEIGDVYLEEGNPKFYET